MARLYYSFRYTPGQTVKLQKKKRSLINANTAEYVQNRSLNHLGGQVLFPIVTFLLLLFISNQIEGIQSIYNLICCFVILSWKGDHPAMSPQSCRSEVQRLFSLRLLIGCVSVSSSGLDGIL